MTLNPFAPTFCPQQRPKLYSLSRNQRLVAMDSSEKSDFPAKVAKTSLTNSHSSQIEEQIHFLSAQLNQLQTFSEASIQQTTTLLQKFPLAHLKQVQYPHSAQLTVAKLHQDLESEKLERQTLHLLVFQLQKDLLFIQNTLMNQTTGNPPKPFSIDPPSEGTSALPFPTPPQPLQLLPPITPWNMLFRISTLEKTVQDDTRVITPFYRISIASWKLVRPIPFYGGYLQWDLSSIQQNPPIVDQSLLMTSLRVSVALSFEIILMGTISSFDFTPRESIQSLDNSELSFLLSSLGTTMVFYDGHFLKLLISASGTSWTHWMCGHKQFHPHKNLPSDDLLLLSRTTHSLLPSTSTSHILNFSAKLKDTL